MLHPYHQFGGKWYISTSDTSYLDLVDPKTSFLFVDLDQDHTVLFDLVVVDMELGVVPVLGACHAECYTLADFLEFDGVVLAEADDDAALVRVDVADFEGVLLLGFSLHFGFELRSIVPPLFSFINFKSWTQFVFWNYILIRFILLDCSFFEFNWFVYRIYRYIATC